MKENDYGEQLNITFPKKTERQQLLQELKDMAKENGAELTGNEIYQKYVNAVEELEQEMHRLSTPGEKDMDDPFKSLLAPELTKKDKNNLLSLMVKAASSGEAFLAETQNQKNSIEKGVPGVGNKHQGIMAKDFDIIWSYNPEDKKSLPDLQEKARQRTIDFRNKQMSTMSNLQNSRIPMTVLNSRGEKRNGVFTKANYNHVKSDFYAFLNKAKEHCNDNGKREIDHIISSYRGEMLLKNARKRNKEKIKSTEKEDYIIGHMMKNLDYNFPKNPMNPAETKSFLEDVVNIETSNISDQAMKILTDGFNKVKDDVGISINNWDLELRDGDRIDNRNSAMSAVASLFGVSGLIARSENMKYIDEKGNEVEGTFMEFAKGIDIYKDIKQASHLSADPLKKQGLLYKQLADLQILDYICNNVDRHPGNMVYQVDGKGNVIGIQGIDNDSSFGNANPHEPDIYNLRVISKSMAEKVQNMHPGMLRFVLRGRGLSENEIEKSAKRLQLIKENMEIGTIRVVNDKDFAKLTKDELKPPKGESNLFMSVPRYIKKRVKNARLEGYSFEPLTEERKVNLKAVDATERKGTLGGAMGVFHDLAEFKLNNQKDLITKTRGSSGAFRELVDSMGEAVDLYKSLIADKNIDPRAMLTEISARPYLKQISGKFQELMDKANDYLDYKMKDKKVGSLDKLKGKNSYEQKHIDYAKKILSFVDRFNEQLDGPSNDRERQETMNNYEQRNIDHIKQAKQMHEQSKQKPRSL